MENSQNVYYFQLDVSYSECKQLYLPGNQSAVMTAETGQRVQVPIVHLRQYVTDAGIQGRFRLITTRTHKFIKFDKL